MCFSMPSSVAFPHLIFTFYFRFFAFIDLIWAICFFFKFSNSFILCYPFLLHSLRSQIEFFYTLFDLIHFDLLFMRIHSILFAILKRPKIQFIKTKTNWGRRHPRDYSSSSSTTSSSSPSLFSSSPSPSPMPPPTPQSPTPPASSSATLSNSSS